MRTQLSVQWSQKNQSTHLYRISDFSSGQPQTAALRQQHSSNTDSSNTGQPVAILAQITEHGDHMDRNVPVSTFSGKPMWDILDIQDGDIHGEGLQNRTESQVGKDQMGGESEKG